MTACVSGGQILNKPGASPEAFSGETVPGVVLEHRDLVEDRSTKLGETLLPETPVNSLKPSRCRHSIPIHNGPPYHFVRSIQVL